jgi:hypothetical protein
LRLGFVISARVFKSSKLSRVMDFSLQLAKSWDVKSSYRAKTTAIGDLLSGGE